MLIGFDKYWCLRHPLDPCYSGLIETSLEVHAHLNIPHFDIIFGLSKTGFVRYLESQLYMMRDEK